MCKQYVGVKCVHVFVRNAMSLFFRSISLSLELCTRCVSMLYAFITCFDSVIQKSRLGATKKPHKQLIVTATNGEFADDGDDNDGDCLTYICLVFVQCP